MISSLAWIPRGAAKAVPGQTQLAEDELAAFRDAADAQAPSEEGGDSDSSDSDSGSGPCTKEAAAVAKAKAFAAAVTSTGGGAAAAGAFRGSGADSLASAMQELDMDHYDDDNDGADGPLTRILGGGNPGMAYHRNPRDDPYLRRDPGDAAAKRRPSGDEDSDDEESSSEAEDLHLRDDDLLILAARNEDDVSHLEVWVYEEPDERGGGNLFVHHALMLSAFPLAVAWLDCDPRGGRHHGNLAAVASFEPGIEIWDLDVLDGVEPVGVLGGADYQAARDAAAAGGKKKAAKGSAARKKAPKAPKVPKVPVRAGSHEDAVLGLAWNREYRNVLASASADRSVKLWDVSTQQASYTLRHHAGKVQAVAWNPAEAPVLLSGGFDKQACMADMRMPEGEAARWEVPADVEALAWDPHSPTCFAVSADNGGVLFWDARRGAGGPPLAQLAAHGKAATSVSYCPEVPGLCLTASTDKKVKLWALGAGGSPPALLAAEDLQVGAVFSAAFCRDAPMVVAAGGAKGAVAVWDTRSSEAVRGFAERQGGGGGGGGATE